MNKSRRNIYKICRELAGLTQEQSSALLSCGVRTLAGYESYELDERGNERGNRPNGDIVARMVDVYRIPALAYWHFKSDIHLGKFLPDVFEPQSGGDMGFLVVLSSDDLEEALEIVKEVLADGRISPHEHGSLERFAYLLRTISGRLLSAALFAETTIAQDEAMEATA